MLNHIEPHLALPAQDIERARRFYTEILGFDAPDDSEGGLRFSSGGGSFLVYPSHGRSDGSFTQGGWAVDDIEREVKELRARGVVFEGYDFPDLKTQDGIAELNGSKSAWFKDSEGNLLGLVQPAAPAGG